MTDLKEGQRFRDFDEFTAAVNAYGVATNVVFTTLDSKRNGPHQYVKLACKHFGNPRIRRKGIRPFQRTFKLNCPAFVYAKQAEGCVRITRMVLKHENHGCDPQNALLYPERRQLDKHEKEVVSELVSGNLTSAVIQTEVQKLTGKCLKLQDLANLRYKLQEEARGSLSKVEQAIAVMVDVVDKDPDAVIIIGFSSPEEPEGKLKLINLQALIADSNCSEETTQSEKELVFIFIQLGSMRQTFAKYPEVLIMDNSYNITETCMPLNLCMAMDSYGCGRIISYSFVGNEVQPTMVAVLTCLKKANPEAVKEITTVVIDKDAKERAAVRQVFGDDITVELCLFHVHHYLKEHTKDIKDGKVREATRKIVRSIVYSNSNEEYVARKEMLKNVAPEEYYQYFLREWDPIKEQWVYYEKLFVPNFGNNTINQAACKNGQHKEALKSTSTLAESIRWILQCHETKEQSVAFHVYEPTVKPSSVLGNTDTGIADVASACTSFAAKLLLGQIENLEDTHKYTPDGSTCKCIFYKSVHLPCRHIFLERRSKGEPMLRVEDIPERWLKSSLHGEVSQVFDPLDTIQATDSLVSMTFSKKYSEALDVAKDICVILSRRGTEQYNAGMQNLRNLRDLLMNGNDIVMAEVTMDQTEADQESDVSTVVPAQTAESSAASTTTPGTSAPSTAASDSLGVNCLCGDLVVRRTVTRGKNKGGQFLVCSKSEDKCGFFRWVSRPSNYNASDSKLDVVRKISSGWNLPKSLKVRGRPKGSGLAVIGTKRKAKKGQHFKTAKQKSGQKKASRAKLYHTDEETIPPKKIIQETVSQIEEL